MKETLVVMTTMDVMATDLLEMFLLLLGVGVVEPHNELAVVADLVILVQQGGLGVADVKVTRGLRWKPDDHLPHLSSRQLHKLTNILLLSFRLWGGMSI